MGWSGKINTWAWNKQVDIVRSNQRKKEEDYLKELKKETVKKSDKYDYYEGKQITDPDTGKRVYEINSYRLPSVTTILGATKNQEFLKEWKAKVGEQEAGESKNVSSAGYQYAQIPRVIYYGCGLR